MSSWEVFNSRILNVGCVLEVDKHVFLEQLAGNQQHSGLSFIWIGTTYRVHQNITWKTSEWHAMAHFWFAITTIAAKLCIKTQEPTKKKNITDLTRFGLIFFLINVL